MLSDSKLDEWFTKKSAEPSQKKINVLETSVGNISEKRLCVLSPAASQKYCTLSIKSFYLNASISKNPFNLVINMRCLTKPYGQVDSWNRFKEAMFQCQLTKYQINLLLYVDRLPKFFIMI
jgi:hypothetical protein